MNTVIVRGYGAGKLLFVDRVEVREEELSDKIVEFAKRHIERVAGYQMHMLEFELVGAPEAERFFRFGTDPRSMVMPIEVLVLPDKCADCGAVLMGGATRHSKDCSFRKLIEEAFPDYEMPKDGP